MRCLIFDKSLTYDTRRAEPAPVDGDTLLRVRQAGICSTDLEITKGYMGFRGVLVMLRSFVVLVSSHWMSPVSVA